MKKLKKLHWILIAIAAVLLVAVVVFLNLKSNAKKHEEASVAALSSDMYRKLYSMKNTKSSEEEKLTELRSLTAYYGYNADVSKAEVVKVDGKNGIVITLLKKGAYELQSKELEQQAKILLVLVPDLEYVEYQLDGATYRKWQQFGENSGGNVFVADGDKEMKKNVKDGYAFQIFMDNLRPLYASQSLHEVVGKVLQERANESFGDEELAVEAHRIVSALGKDGKMEICALTTVGGYRFINGNLIRLDKMNVKPCKAILVKNAAGLYELEHADFPNIGQETQEAVYQMFIKQTADNVMGKIDTFTADLVNQEKKVAGDYMASVGRTGDVGTFAEFPVEYLDQKGVSPEVMDNILVNEKLLPYPIFVGTQEFTENDVRYVYETGFDDASKTILFKKYDYKTKAVAEEYKVSAETGAFVG